MSALEEVDFGEFAPAMEECLNGAQSAGGEPGLDRCATRG